MIPQILSFRPELKKRLREIEDESERIFLRLGDTIPRLVQEMRTSINNSRTEVGGTGAAATTDQSDLEAISSRIVGTIEEGEASVSKLHERDATVLRSLQTAMENLRAVIGVIPEIRYDSEEMELVSLNAMTMALKAGQAGRAFSFITDELKRLSAMTIERSESITELGDRSLESFTHFEQLLQRAGSEQEHLFARFHGKVEESLGKLRGAIRDLIGQLQSVQRRSEDVLDPINRLMESLQLQDLIRQSIDHVLLSLDAMDSNPNDGTNDSEEDRDLFAQQVPALASQLIGDVADQLEHSAEVFESLVSEAADRMEAVDAERRKIGTSSTSLEQSSSGDASTQAAFAESIALQSQLLDDLDSNLELKGRVAAQSDQIKASVRELQRQFRQFETLVSRFHNIDIASRIEVSKQEVLQEMDSTIQQMTQLTRRIEKDVQEAIGSTEGFIAVAGGVVEAAEKSYADQSTFLSAFRSRIETEQAALDATRNKVNALIEEFSLFTAEFHNVFEETRTNSGQLRNLARELADVAQDLAGVAPPQGEGSADRLQSARFLGLIKRFTILSHKQKAGALTGVDVESGVESGEVTLF